MTIEKTKVLTAGILSLVVNLGVARFAYTPLLPLMQEQAGVSLAQGGWLASINYMGYFSGVVLVSFLSSLKTKDTYFRLGLILALVSSLGHGIEPRVLAVGDHALSGGPKQCRWLTLRLWLNSKLADAS